MFTQMYYKKYFVLIWALQIYSKSFLDTPFLYSSDYRSCIWHDFSEKISGNVNITGMASQMFYMTDGTSGKNELKWVFFSGRPFERFVNESSHIKPRLYEIAIPDGNDTNFDTMAAGAWNLKETTNRLSTNLNSIFYGRSDPVSTIVYDTSHNPWLFVYGGSIWLQESPYSMTKDFALLDLSSYSWVFLTASSVGAAPVEFAAGHAPSKDIKTGDQMLWVWGSTKDYFPNLFVIGLQDAFQTNVIDFFIFNVDRDILPVPRIHNSLIITISEKLYTYAGVSNDGPSRRENLLYY